MRPRSTRTRRSRTGRSSPCSTCSSTSPTTPQRCGRSRRGWSPARTLVITVPAMQWAFSSWDTELGHHRRYSRRRLRAVVAAAGFDVESVTYLFPELFPLLVVRRLRRAPREQVDFPQLAPRIDALGHADRLGDDGDAPGLAVRDVRRGRRHPRDRDRRRRRPTAGCGSCARCSRDTESYLRLHEEAIAACRADGWTGELRFVVVDDSAGTDHEVAQLAAHPDVAVLTPPFGLGHQRAIVYGLRSIAADVARRRRRRHDGLRRRGPAEGPAAPGRHAERDRCRPRAGPAHEALRAARVPRHVRVLPAAVPRAHRAHDPLRQLRRPARRVARRDHRPPELRPVLLGDAARPEAIHGDRARAPVDRASPARRA